MNRLDQFTGSKRRQDESEKARAIAKNVARKQFMQARWEKMAGRALAQGVMVASSFLAGGFMFAVGRAAFVGMLVAITVYFGAIVTLAVRRARRLERIPAAVDRNGTGVA